MMQYLTKALLAACWFMLLTFPVMGIKLNSVDQTVEWQFDRVILLGVTIFFLSMLWNWCFSRKARGIPLIRLPEGLGKGLHSLVTLPNRNTTTRLTSLGLLLAVMIVMPLVSSFYQTNIMISAMLYVILALGLNIAVGIAGQLVLGYVAFYAVGAYSYALLNQAFGLGFWACLPVGGFMAIVFGLALGFPVLRLRGDYLAIVTLACGEIIKNIINVLYVGMDGNGLHLCDEIRGRGQHTYIMFITANDKEGDMLKGYEAGCTDYITKPFSVMVLCKKVAAVFANMELRTPKHDVFEDEVLKIDFSEQRASLAGEPLDFTPKEYRTLFLFVKNPRIILTKRQILEKLWDIDGDFVDEHTLTTIISRIRKKIETDERKYIKTAYGMGYQWIGGEPR